MHSTTTTAPQPCTQSGAQIPLQSPEHHLPTREQDHQELAQLVLQLLVPVNPTLAPRAQLHLAEDEARLTQDMHGVDVDDSTAQGDTGGILGGI